MPNSRAGVSKTPLDLQSAQLAGVYVVKEVQVLEAPIGMDIQMLVVPAPRSVFVSQFIMNGHRTDASINELDGCPGRANGRFIELYCLDELLIAERHLGIHVGVAAQT